MRLQFEVGDQERHVVTFSFNKIWGTMVIAVDGQSVKRQLHVMSTKLIWTYEFIVGDQEQHHVRIDKERELTFAGFRPQTCRAYVDGQLAAETNG